MDTTQFDDQALQAFLDHLLRNPENEGIDIESLQQEALQQHSQQQAALQQQQLLQSGGQGQQLNGQLQQLSNGIHINNGVNIVNGHHNNHQTQLLTNGGSVVITANGNGGHQLPDSPPDSGSEPPFSPPDHVNKVITIGSPPGGTSPSNSSTTSNNQTSSSLSPSHSSDPTVTSTTTMHPSIVPPIPGHPSQSTVGHHPHHPHHPLNHPPPPHHHLHHHPGGHTLVGHDGNTYNPVPPPYPRQLIGPNGQPLGHPGQMPGGPLPQHHPHHHPLIHHGHPHMGPVPGSAIGPLGPLGPHGGQTFSNETTYMYRSNDVEIEVPIVPSTTSTSSSPSSGTGGAIQKKRKYQQQQQNGDTNPSPKSGSSSASSAAVVGTTAIVNIKQEPLSSLDINRRCNNGRNNVPSPELPCIQSMRPSCEDDFGFDYPNNGNDNGTGSVYLDSAYQCIKFEEFLEQTWHTLYDEQLKEIHRPNFRVDADKGFNFSNADDAFVCQKKNHFQVTVHVQPIGVARYVKSLTDNSPKEITKFFLHFYGCKTESPTQTIKVEQSQSDRSKKSFHPQEVELIPGQVSKTTVGRLHFSETTSNNMRKKGKPNPDQRYFRLVVTLAAHCTDGNVYHIVSHASERIIVRASNPGQFENDMELSWQKGSTPESIFHAGRVGINTDRPDESLVIHGNVKVTGHIIQPSDQRAKKYIKELDTKEQLKNVSNMRIVKYNFRPEFAKDVGLTGNDVLGTGVLAQEVAVILPDAVKPAGDMVLTSGETIENFLVVNNDRIFMENVGAVKELCKVTDNLETRIDELERMNNKLRKINRFDSIKSVMSSASVTSSSTVTCHSSYSANLRKGNNQLRNGCQGHRHKLDNRCQRSSCNHSNGSGSNTSELCTNRFMQFIIMILVLIMAFCLAMIATLYILDYHKKHNALLNGHPSLAHVVGVHTPPTGQQYLVVHSNSGGTPTIQHINTNPPVHGHGQQHVNGLDSPSPDNSLSVSSLEKVNRDKNQSPGLINRPVTASIPSMVVTQARTRPPSPVLTTSHGSFSTTRFSSVIPTISTSSSGINPFNDLTEGGKSSSLDRDRQKERSHFGSHNDPGHTDTSGSLNNNSHGHSEDDDVVNPNVAELSGSVSKSVSNNPVSNGVSLNHNNHGHSSGDPEINI